MLTKARDTTGDSFSPSSTESAKPAATSSSVPSLFRSDNGLSARISQCLSLASSAPLLPLCCETRAFVPPLVIAPTEKEKKYRSFPFVTLRDPISATRAGDSREAVGKYVSSPYFPPFAMQASKRELLPSLVHHSLIMHVRERAAEDEWNAKGITTGLEPAAYHAEKRKHVLEEVRRAFRAVTEKEDSDDTKREQERDGGERLTKLMKEFMKDDEASGRFARQVTYQTEETAKETQEERLVKLRGEIDALRENLSQNEGESRERKAATAELVTRARQCEAQLQSASESLAEREREFRVKKRTMDLLPEADANIRELKGIAATSATRIAELADAWEVHRVPLVDELRRLSERSHAAKGESKAKLEEIKAMRGTMRTVVDEIKEKEERCKQLLAAIEGGSQGLSRPAYTKRILEIVKNVKRQSVDIAKVVADTVQLQRDINAVSDTLKRSYAAVDELVFADAKSAKGKDAPREVYKLLALLKSHFTTLVESVNEAGTLRNNTLNQSNVAELMESRVTSQAAAGLEEDLKAIKKENDVAEEKLKALKRELLEVM